MTTVVVPYHLDAPVPGFDPPLPGGGATVVTAELPEGDPWQRMAHLYESVAATVAAGVHGGARPVVFSSDCTTALGTVAGLQRAGVDPTVVWFDGHGDVQTLETTTSGYLGGMPLRILVGYRPELIATALGLRPVPERRVVLVDARDLDPPEAAYLERSEVVRASVAELTGDLVPDGPIYLHLDVDVVDPAELPGLLFPAPGGPGLAAVAAAARRVVATGRVAAVGLACTWHAGSGAADVARPHIDELLAEVTP